MCGRERKCGERESVCVGDCMWDRERECVRERERLVWESERERVCVGEGERERVCVGEGERECVCVGEGERECVWERERV